MKSGTKTVSLILACIIFAAFVLRLVPVFRESLGGDETFTLKVVAQPWAEAFRTIKNDLVTPPFYAVLLKAWSGLAGKSLAAMRLLSCLWGLAVVALTVAFGKMVFSDDRIPLLAGALVAFNEAQILVAFYARHYSFYPALVLVLLIVMWKVLTKEDTLRWWVAFAAVSVVLVYTHYIGWLFILGMLPAVLAKKKGVDTRRYFGSCVLAFLLFLPWLLTELPLIKARGLSMDLKVPPASLKSLLNTAGIFAGKRLWEGSFFLPALVSLVLITGAVVYFFRARGEVPIFRDKTAAFLLAGPALLVPGLLFILCLPPLSLPYWGNRHVLPAHAPFALLLGFGLIRFARRSRAGFALGAVVLVGLQLVPSLFGTFGYRFDPYDKVAAYLIRENTDRNRIFVIPEYGTDWLNYYLDPGNPSAPFPAGPSARLPVNRNSQGGLPGSFWLVYRPAAEADRALVRYLARGDFSVIRSSQFMRRKSDVRGLAAVFLRKRAAL